MSRESRIKVYAKTCDASEDFVQSLSQFLSVGACSYLEQVTDEARPVWMVQLFVRAFLLYYNTGQGEHAKTLFEHYITTQLW